MSRKRVWGFTLNNWTEKEMTHWHNNISKYKIIKYRIQSEIGEQKTPHLQGAVTFKNAVRFSTLKKLLPRANWYIANNPKALYAYCNKEETATGEVWEWELPEKKELTEAELRFHLHSQYLDRLKTDEPPDPITYSQTIKDTETEGRVYEFPLL